MENDKANYYRTRVAMTQHETDRYNHALLNGGQGITTERKCLGTTDQPTSRQADSRSRLTGACEALFLDVAKVIFYALCCLPLLWLLGKMQVSDHAVDNRPMMRLVQGGAR
jgi:hypothetical protein